MPIVFAYGSNLDAAQMRRRCPRSMFAGRAEVRGFALSFAGHSASWGGAVATVLATGDRRDVVPGALWLLDGGDLDRLDDYEGVPVVYQRREVALASSDARVRRADIYVRNVTTAARPSLRYFRTIASAYGRLNFDSRLLERAVASCGGFAK